MRVLLLILGLGCAVLVKAQDFEVIAPSTFINGRSFPFAVEVFDQNGLDKFYSADISVAVTGGTLPNNLVKVMKGRSMTTVTASGSGTLSITSSEFALNPSENLSQSVYHSGTISTNETWSSTDVHRVTDDLVVAAGATLTIEPGCWVVIDSAANITVEGNLSANGTPTDPTVFCSNTQNAWGGISVTGTAIFSYCFLNNGGGDYTQTFGHSNSQPVVRSTNGNVTLNRCFIFDCEGKALAASNGNLVFQNGGISRCDSGGEFGNSDVKVKNTHVMEIPDGDGILEDDDNDGFYFYGTNPSQLPYEVDSCVFMIGEDDAIDHNGSILEITNCWIEGFENEGLAASNGNSVYIFNSLFKDCEQGIEAGYGNPSVTVDHCVMVDNEYGLRFGDWYDWGCTGNITCTNSIMYNNYDNVHNFDVLTNGPVANAIDLTYSIPSDAEYEAATGNILGDPLFNSEYLLLTGSPGLGAANDGTNMGLIGPLANGVAENVSPEFRQLRSFSVYSLGGQLLSTGDTHQDLVACKRHLKNGIYLIQLQFETSVSTQKVAIVR